MEETPRLARPRAEADAEGREVMPEVMVESKAARMTSKHYALIGGCLMGIGGMLAALPSWDLALSPSFIGGALVVVGTQAGAIFTERP